MLCVRHLADCIWLRGDSRISAAEVPEAGQETGKHLGHWPYVACGIYVFADKHMSVDVESVMEADLFFLLACGVVDYKC